MLLMTTRPTQRTGISDKAVGSNIRTARERNGVTQAELVTKLGALGWKIDAPALSAIENGRRSVRVSQLSVLAQALETDAAEFLLPEDSVLGTFRNYLTDRHLKTVEDYLTEALSEVRQLRAVGRGTWREEFKPGATEDTGTLSLELMPEDPDHGKHPEA